MPGTFVVRPVEANLTGSLSLSSYSRNIDPYCEIKIGHNSTRSHPAKDFGTHPHWEEELVIQQGDEHVGKVIVKDTNKFNPNRNIGEVKLDLDDVTTKGRVVKWFDINRDNRKQGEILMEVTYTNANPLTKSFHESMREGAGVPPSRQDEVLHEIEHKHHITEKDRRDFYEATKDLKFRYGCGRDHDKEPHHKKTLKEFIDEREILERSNREKIARKDPLMNQPHPKRQQPTRQAAPQEHRKAPFWETDPTAKHIAGKHYPKELHHHQGGILVDVPDNPAKDAWEHRDPSAEHRPHFHPHHSKYHDECVGELRHGHWEEGDPTVSHTRVHPGYADSGMSNPNTMKLGVNHDLPEDHFNYDREAYADEYHAYPPAQKGSVNDSRFHHIQGSVDMSKGPEKGTWNERDPTVNHMKLRPGTSNSGMSNPNTIKMGANLHDPPRNMPAKHVRFAENEVVYNDPRVHHGRHLTEIPNYAAKEAWEVSDPTVRDTRVQPGSADSGMSNPNTMKLGVNQSSAQNYDEAPLVADAQPRGRYARTVVQNTSEVPVKGPYEQENPTITHPRGRQYAATQPREQSAGHRGGVLVDVPENPAKEAYEHRDPSVDHHPHISERHSKYHRDCSKEGHPSHASQVNKQIASNQNQRFEPVVDTVTDAAPRGRYSRKNLDQQIPNAPLPKNQLPAKDRYGQPFHHQARRVDHGPYIPEHAHEEYEGMSNPNMIGMDYRMLKGLRNAEQQLLNQKRVEGFQECSHPTAFGIDKITKTNDTSLGVFQHPEHLWDNGMSDPNNARFGYNHHAERPSTGNSGRGYTTAEHTHVNEVDKITRVNDTTLGRQRDILHVWDAGMSDPNSMQKGWNHADARNRVSFNLQHHGNQLTMKNLGPDDIDKITDVHDTNLSHHQRRHFY